MPADTGCIGPVQDRIAGELAAIVADDHLRPAAPGHDGIEFTRHAQARQRCICRQGETLPRAIIDNRQDPEAAAVGQLIRHEIERPAIVRPQRKHHGRSCSDGAFAAAATAHGKLLLPVVNAVLIFPKSAEVKFPTLAGVVISR